MKTSIQTAGDQAYVAIDGRNVFSLSKSDIDLARDVIATLDAPGAVAALLSAANKKALLAGSSTPVLEAAGLVEDGKPTRLGALVLKRLT